MAGRYTAFMTLALCSLYAAPSFGQSGYMPPNYMPMQPGAGHPGPAGYVMPQYAPQMGLPQYSQGPGMPPPSAMPHMAGGYCPHAADPHHVCSDACFQGPANIEYEQLPDDRGWFYGESPTDRLIKNTLKNTTVRLSYMLWDIGAPGDALLGAPVEGLIDPREPFPVTVGGVPVGTAQVPSLAGISLEDHNGMEALIGVPLSFGTLEGSIFKLEKHSEEFQFPGLPSSDVVGQQFFYATSTLTNGEYGENQFLYDRSFTATFTTDWWGTDLNLVLNTNDMATGLKFKPIVGFKWLSQWERLRQVGEFDQFGALDPPLRSEITSKTRNHVYAPQLGLRTEVDTKWVTFGMEPKIAFGVNNYETNLIVENLRFEGDPRVETLADGVNFSPMFDLDVYGKLNVSENFSLFISYNLMVVAKFARPHSSIRYDDFGVGAATTGLATDPGFENITVSGMTVGGEFRFR